MKTEHFFRPVFTRRLIQRLHRGEIVNLVGKDSEGSTRLLEDIRDAQLDQTAVILVDMAEYENDHEGFIKAISQVIGIDAWVDNMSDWIEAVQAHGARLYLLLDHFDTVKETYPREFLAQLNRLQLVANISLLCVTQAPIEMRITDLDSFVAQGQFESEVVKLPPISFRRIQEELLRLQPRLKGWQEITTQIFAHPHRYQVLAYVTTKLEKLPESKLEKAEKWIQKWMLDYNQAFMEAAIGEGADSAHKKPENLWHRIRRIFTNGK